MKVSKFSLAAPALALAALALPLSAVGASAAPLDGTAPKPGFPAGTWTGKGAISGSSSEYGQETRTSGSASFTLKVTRGGRVSGTGKWVTTEDRQRRHLLDDQECRKGQLRRHRETPTYAGTQTVTTSFADGARDDGNTFELPFKGALRITRAGHCRVTGGHSAGGVSFKWTARLAGSGTCNT